MNKWKESDQFQKLVKKYKDDKALDSHVGRRMTFEDPLELVDAIIGYFKYCEPHPEKINITIETEEKGVVKFIESDEIRTTEQRPYTISGLAVFLGLDRSTLIQYCQRADHDPYLLTIKKAKNLIESYNEERLHGKTQVAGVIFNLKNNFGWKDVIHNEVTDNTAMAFLERIHEANEKRKRESIKVEVTENKPTTQPGGSSKQGLPASKSLQNSKQG